MKKNLDTPAQKSYTTFSLGTLTADFNRHLFQVKGKSVRLSPKEKKILLALIEARGVVVSRQQIIDSAWDGEQTLDSRTVDQHMARLRRKVGRGVVNTVPLFGYQISPELVAS